MFGDRGVAAHLLLLNRDPWLRLLFQRFWYVYVVVSRQLCRRKDASLWFETWSMAVYGDVLKVNLSLDGQSWGRSVQSKQCKLSTSEAQKRFISSHASKLLGDTNQNAWF